jgi:hypothetical protein
MKLSLSKKPDAVAWSIEDLLEKVAAGQVRLPEFQRLFKWSPDDVLELFDSIERGFPIGTLLFWRGPAATTPSSRPLESVATPPTDESDLLFILDGQQRLTSLSGVLLAAGEPTDERFRIAFALDRDELIIVAPGEPWPEFALPLFRALDSVNLLTWIASKGPSLNVAHQRRALEVGKAVREYRVPAYIVTAEAEDTARLIFDRTNASGKRLTKGEIFKALHEGKTSQQPNSLDALEKSVEALGFGELQERLLLQATAAVAGLDVWKIDHQALSRPELASALSRTAPALRHALAFLRNDAHIPSVALLPYNFPVVALSRFFDLHPAPNARSRELLTRWVWRGAISQMHWAHEQSYLRETLRAMTGLDEEAEVQRMLALLPRHRPTFEFGPYSLKAAATKLQLLALIDLHPRDLMTGELLDAAGLVARELSAAVHQLADGENADPVEVAARQTIFGRVIQPTGPRARLLDALVGPRADDALLATLGLDGTEARAAAAGEPFAVQRQNRLAPVINDFLERRARWSESDRPSLASLEVDDSP